MKRNKKSKNPNNMTFREHLHELKLRALFTLFIFIIIFLFWYLHCNDIINIVTEIGANSGYSLVYISPHEVLVQQLRLAALFSLLTIIPLILYQVCAFISPIFEKKTSLIKLFVFCIVLMILMLIGIAFSYIILLPFIYKFMNIVGNEANIKAQVSLENYINTFVSITMWISMFMEIPLICVILTRLGIITADLMKKARPVVIVTIFIIAAIITPPDIISQCMVAVPLVVLYQLSIMICKFIRRK